MDVQEDPVIIALQNADVVPSRKQRRNNIERYREHILSARQKKNLTWNQVAQVLTDTGLTVTGKYLSSIFRVPTKNKKKARAKKTSEQAIATHVTPAPEPLAKPESRGKIHSSF